MADWNVPIPDAIFDAGGEAGHTAPTGSQTPPQQPVPPQPDIAQANQAILNWNANEEVVIMEVDQPFNENNNDPELDEAKKLWIDSSTDQLDHQPSYYVRAQTNTVVTRWADFSTYFISGSMMSLIFERFYALEPFQQAWRSSLQLVDHIYASSAPEVRPGIAEQRQHVKADAADKLRSAAQQFIKVKACQSSQIEKLIPAHLSRSDFLICCFHQVSLRERNLAPGQSQRCGCNGCIGNAQRPGPNLFPALPSQINAHLSGSFVSLPFSEFYDFVCMDEEVDTDQGYYDLCWTAWNDQAVQWHKSKYAFASSAQHEKPPIVPNPAV